MAFDCLSISNRYSETCQTWTFDLDKTFVPLPVALEPQSPSAISYGTNMWKSKRLGKADKRQLPPENNPTDCCEGISDRKRSDILHDGLTHNYPHIHWHPPWSLEWQHQRALMAGQIQDIPKLWICKHHLQPKQRLEAPLNPFKIPGSCVCAIPASL